MPLGIVFFRLDSLRSIRSRLQRARSRVQAHHIASQRDGRLARLIPYDVQPTSNGTGRLRLAARPCPQPKVRDECPVEDAAGGRDAGRTERVRDRCRRNDRNRRGSRDGTSGIGCADRHGGRARDRYGAASITVGNRSVGYGDHARLRTRLPPPQALLRGDLQRRDPPDRVRSRLDSGQKLETEAGLRTDRNFPATHLRQLGDQLAIPAAIERAHRFLDQRVRRV